jgi:hypothetical protein
MSVDAPETAQGAPERSGEPLHARLSRHFRHKRFRRIAELVDGIVAERGRCRIVDLGGTPQYWERARKFLEGLPIEITIVNVTHDRIPAEFNCIEGDATDLSGVHDMTFDFAHSNSVIEHVGDWAKMQAFAANVRRLAPSYYVQTPNFWFPYEPHFRAPFFHWLPEQLRYRLVMRFALGFSEAKKTVDGAMRRIQSARLLDRMQLRALFPDARIEREAVLGLTKSLIAVRM